MMKTGLSLTELNHSWSKEIIRIQTMECFVDKNAQASTNFLDDQVDLIVSHLIWSIYFEQSTEKEKTLSTIRWIDFFHQILRVCAPRIVQIFVIHRHNVQKSSWMMSLRTG